MTGLRTTLRDAGGRTPPPGRLRTATIARLAAVLATVVALTVAAAWPAAAAPVSGAATRPPLDAPPAASDLPPPGAGPLQVGADGRSFETANGAPFFWMGDTAWSLFVNLDREETIDYLDNRAGKGFTVIQAVAVATPSGGLGPNAYGDMPHSGDIGRPSTTEGDDPADDEEYDYWDHVEFVVQEAAARNLYVALLPAWSSATAGSSLTTGNAAAYGEFLGSRFGTRYTNIVWMAGGDDNNGFFPEIWRELAKGITVGTAGSEDYGTTFMTYHPGGGKNSATALDGEEWLDFHTHQSGHLRIDGNDGGFWQNIELSLGTAKPFLDSEPGYEEHPVRFDPSNGYLDDDDVRAFAYLSVFSGAAGHTYGHHNIWMMYGSHRGGDGAHPKDIDWRTAMDSSGAQQMAHFSELMTAHPAPRVPDLSLVTSETFGTSNAAIRATRAADGSYVLVYSGQGRAFDLTTNALAGTDVSAYWFDPRSGRESTVEDVDKGESVTFSPPTQGEDWALVVESADRATTGDRPPAHDPVTAPVSIMPLGDSITYGYEHGSYRTALWRQLVTEDGHEVDFVGSRSDGPAELPDKDHEGHPGLRVGELEAAAEGWLERHDPDIVLLHIGTNDLIRGDPADVVAGRLDTLLTTIFTTSPETTVITASLIPLDGGGADWRAFNDAVADIVAAHEHDGRAAVLADMSTSGIAGRDDVPDGVHPSPSGYAKMAEVWYPLVQGELGRSG